VFNKSSSRGDVRRGGGGALLCPEKASSTAGLGGKIGERRRGCFLGEESAKKNLSYGRVTNVFIGAIRGGAVIRGVS